MKRFIFITYALERRYEKAVDDEIGSKAGTRIAVVNQIARRVKETPGYDNVVFDTFAYQYSENAPVGILTEGER